MCHELSQRVSIKKEGLKPPLYDVLPYRAIVTASATKFVDGSTQRSLRVCISEQRTKCQELCEFVIGEFVLDSGLD